MKQIAQNYKSGELSVLDVPTPVCRPGGVLVQSLFSLISTGTEMMKLAEAKMSMVGKARARPDQVRKVLDTVSQQGAVATYKKVMNRLDSYTPLGYSLCGVVVEVGPGAEEFRVGDLVAAAGNEYALHAEYNWVPSNLCAVVPKGVLPEHAAFSTVGAIAMQGVRRAEVQLGDTACVIGLGLVGQLVVRLLVASGVRVTGLDVLEERCRAAEQAGAALCAPPTDEGIDAVQQALGEISGGRGADHLFLAAGGSSNGPVEAAARLARDRAHVVDIGKTRLDLPWNAYYDKELDVRFSRSYGPGRYDDRYELDGIDYPAGYVRWTERRNLECFLDLIARKEIEVETLISGRFPLDQASTVYAGMASGSVNAVGVLLEYPAPTTEDRPLEISRVVSSPAPATRSGSSGRLAIGFIGAGNYASSMLLPNLARQGNAYLSHVATTRSLSAVNAQRRFGFKTASTTADAVLDDESLDAIFVVTRHHTHADLVCRALETGKAVFVEKPLALTESDLERVIDVIAMTGNNRLMVGFNRRFAPLLAKMQSQFGPPRNATARYLVNAGSLAADSWYTNEELEGSRFAGEGGHFIDTLSWWTGSLPAEVYALSGPEKGDVHATVRFQNGSTGTINYITGGNSRYPKETLDAAGAGRSARLDNFRKATVWTGQRQSAMKSRGGPDKGQQAQLVKFVESIAFDTVPFVRLEARISSGQIVVAFESIPGVHYALQGRDTLTTPWSANVATVTATGNRTEVTLPKNAPTTFLRLVAGP
jgi:predicted dehydrogenase/threonine dehydrogenase-like Zn-dependent dehydrogenase